MNKRGPKPKYLAPPEDELRSAIALHDSLSDVCRHYGVGRKTLYRWMEERGLPVPRHPMRPKSERLRWATVAFVPARGKRVMCSLYTAWDSMKKRCRGRSPHHFKYYTAKGITVCDEWSDYAAFRKWAVENGFRKGLTLDRKDGNLGYSPGNCRWATRVEQQNNIARVIRLTFGGVTRTLPEWARLTGFSQETLRQRHHAGWTDEQTLTLPLGALRPGKLRGRAAAKAKRLVPSSQPHT